MKTVKELRIKQQPLKHKIRGKTKGFKSHLNCWSDMRHSWWGGGGMWSTTFIIGTCWFHIHYTYICRPRTKQISENIMSLTTWLWPRNPFTFIIPKWTLVDDSVQFDTWCIPVHYSTVFMIITTKTHGTNSKTEKSISSVVSIADV